MAQRTMFRLLTELSSRKWISRTAGAMAKSKWSRRLIPRFARLYGIQVQEAEKGIDEYETLNDFFTRRLKPGSRPLHPGEDTVVSPVDARITAMGDIKDGILLNVKGQDYTLSDLLGGSPRAVCYEQGYYFVLYLSPTDYHRIHSPLTGKIVEKDAIAGRVYPVHDQGLTYMRGVLARNERVVTYIRHANGEAAVVKVGAMNVAGIRYVEELGDSVSRGDELAYFEFGSTVVLLLDGKSFVPKFELNAGDKVRMGEALGTMRGKPVKPGEDVP